MRLARGMTSMLLSRTRHEYHVKSDTRVRVFQVSAIPHPDSVGFVLAASASLSFLDTWFLALISIRLAWRTAQTVTDASQPGHAKIFIMQQSPRTPSRTPSVQK